MWHVLRDMYRAVRSKVVVNGETSTAFDTDVGVRQGSVLSPILFSAFISGVIDEWKREGLGVQIGSRRVGGLLFADDMVLIADSPHMLHRALAVMEEHAALWRYRFNVGKCAVVAMRKKKPTDEVWQLQGQTVPESRSYKYLGVSMEWNSAWHQWSDSRVKKARQCLPTLWYCGARQGALSTSTANRLMEVMLWPAMSYGGELARLTRAEVEAAELVQNAAGRQILGTGRRTAIDVMRGELGWISIEARRQHQQLQYFHRLQRMPADQLTGHVFRHRMCATSDRRKHERREYGLCGMVRDAMVAYGLDAHFAVESTLNKREWRTVSLAAIEAREAAEWRRRLVEGGLAAPHGARAWYNAVKTEWGEEDYLHRGGDSYAATRGRRLMAQMRTGTAPMLQATLHRQQPIAHPSPICNHCGLGQPDTETHALCDCTLHQHERHALFIIVEEEWWQGQHYRLPWWCSERSEWSGMSSELRAQWLLRYRGAGVAAAVAAFIVDIAKRRANQRSAAAADAPPPLPPPPPS